MTVQPTDAVKRSDLATMRVRASMMEPKTLPGGVRVGEASRSIWQHLMEADPEAIPYQSPEWADAACRSAGFMSITRHYRTADGADFVLPLLRQARLPRRLSSAYSMPPAWGIGGLIGETEPTGDLVRAVFEDLKSLGLLSVRIRPNPRHDSIWAAAAPVEVTRIDRRAHILDLTPGFETVRAEKFNSRCRRMAAKAERNGVSIEFDGTGALLDTYYGLYEQSLVRWAAKQNEPAWLARWRGRRRDPLHKMKAAASALGEGFQVGIARKDGQPMAGVILLLGRNANYSRGAMDVSLVGNSGANELLQTHAIRCAAEAGCSHYHMGETGSSATLARFKEKFGAVPVDYAEYQFERLPISKIDRAARETVKKLIGFKDTVQ
ncbi:GNAT family N-acetyltransferase [Cucumibacter marinus]|uniref:GNAT family N-acetyltransferase n=1 Tax=Cucumibacter marinus TaxID=1121252 RepID=UPI00056603D6|nr:GNAT family N-acetyltransferase [Cucumibacter marinus]